MLKEVDGSGKFGMGKKKTAAKGKER